MEIQVGGETLKRLKKFVEEDRLPKAPPLPGKFVSSAGALLVALKIEEDVIKDNRWLIPECNVLSEMTSCSPESEYLVAKFELLSQPFVEWISEIGKFMYHQKIPDYLLAKK